MCEVYLLLNDTETAERERNLVSGLCFSEFYHDPLSVIKNYLLICFQLFIVKIQNRQTDIMMYKKGREQATLRVELNYWQTSNLN